MGKILVLAEKPSVGREIARVLGCKHGGDGSLEGGKYIVTWALGHLVTLADPEAYDKNWKKWDMDFEERLFHPDFAGDFRTRLTPSDINKIQANSRFM